MIEIEVKYNASVPNGFFCNHEGEGKCDALMPVGAYLNYDGGFVCTHYRTLLNLISNSAEDDSIIENPNLCMKCLECMGATNEAARCIFK